MKKRSSVDVFLVVLALVLLVIVGYGVLSRTNSDAVVADAVTGDAAAADPLAESTEVIAADGSAITANFGFTGDAPASSGDAAGDASATLEEIAQPVETSPQWDLVNGSFAIVRARANVNVRVGPGLEHGVMRAIPNETEVQVLRRSFDQQWIRVMMSDGREGWIFGQLLQLSQ
ncbi:MAG: SH3 domain-containing protein [bacterium]|nr:SH3 domain-containing protein [bacterium]